MTVTSRTGRRKTSVARVYFLPGTGQITTIIKTLKNIFLQVLRMTVISFRSFNSWNI